MITSALDLSKYHVNDKVYYIINDCKLVKSRISTPISYPKLIIKKTFITGKKRVDGRYYYSTADNNQLIDQKDLFETAQGARHHINKTLKTILNKLKKQVNC